MYIPLQITLDMQFTLSDILTILAGLGALVGVYTALRKSIVEDKVVIKQLQKEVDKLSTKLESEQNQRDVDNKELWTKLVNIEAGQTQTNVFLEENLKSINRLLNVHDQDIKGVKEKMERQDKDIIEFYRTYDLTKKRDS